MIRLRRTIHMALDLLSLGLFLGLLLLVAGLITGDI